MVCAHWLHPHFPGQAPHAALVVAAGMGSWVGSLKASKTRLACSGSPLLNSASAARKAFIRKSSSPAVRSTRSMKAPRSISFARASRKYKSSTCWRVISSCRLLALYGIWAALQPPFPGEAGGWPAGESAPAWTDGSSALTGLEGPAGVDDGRLLGGETILKKFHGLALDVRKAQHGGVVA